MSGTPTFLLKPEANGRPFIAPNNITGVDPERIYRAAAFSATVPQFPVVTQTSIWGNQVFDLASPTTLGTYASTGVSFIYPGSQMPSTGSFWVYMRTQPQIAINANYGLWGLNGWAGNGDRLGLAMYCDAAGAIRCRAFGALSGTIINLIQFGTAAMTAAQTYDLLWHCNYSLATPEISLWLNGTFQATLTGSTTFPGGLNMKATSLSIGSNKTALTTRGFLHHFAAYSTTVTNPTEYAVGGDIDDELLALDSYYGDSCGSGGTRNINIGSFGI
jgi:hypothetical protein